MIIQLIKIYNKKNEVIASIEGEAQLLHCDMQSLSKELMYQGHTLIRSGGVLIVKASDKYNNEVINKMKCIFKDN